MLGRWWANLEIPLAHRFHRLLCQRCCGIHGFAWSLLVQTACLLRCCLWSWSTSPGALLRYAEMMVWLLIFDLDAGWKQFCGWKAYLLRSKRNLLHCQRSKRCCLKPDRCPHGKQSYSYSLILQQSRIGNEIRCRSHHNSASVPGIHRDWSIYGLVPLSPTCAPWGPPLRRSVAPGFRNWHQGRALGAPGFEWPN